MDPYSKPELIEAIARQAKELADFYANIPNAIFFTRPQRGWAASGNVRHLQKAGMAVLLGLKTPANLLRIFFGRSKRKGRRMKDVSLGYLERLRKGSGAGIYAPVQKGGQGNPRRQSKLIASMEKTCLGLSRALEKFSESELDELQLPHPILGRIPVREMILFHLLHNEHHTGIVRSRLAAGAQLPKMRR